MTKYVLSLTAFALLSLTAPVSAQQLTLKNNFLLERKEFYDVHGHLQGWARYNFSMERMEYFDASGQIIGTKQNNTLFARKKIKDTLGNTKSTKNNNPFIEWEKIKERYGKGKGYIKHYEFRNRGVVVVVLDSKGTLVGYYKYNSFLKRWEYYYNKNEENYVRRILRERRRNVR